MDVVRTFAKFVRGIRTLAIPRLEDLPYHDSAPIQFVYESTASLALGVYVWSDVASALSPLRPMVDNAMYLFRNISLTADTEELDYTTNLVTPPQFYTFLQSDSRAVLFREPIVMNKFYDQFVYKFTFRSNKGQDQLFGAFRGTVAQGPGFVGKTDITLKAVITAQEVIDENFIESFYRPYPKIGKEDN